MPGHDATSTGRKTELNRVALAQFPNQLSRPIHCRLRIAVCRSEQDFRDRVTKGDHVTFSQATRCCGCDAKPEPDPV